MAADMVYDKERKTTTITLRVPEIVLELKFSFAGDQAETIKA